MENKVAIDALTQPQQKKKTKRRGRRLTGLSKQRRIANTRERNRVHVINDCIDRLRDLIPLFPNERKPSKTDTIRLAALYISHLTDLLAVENTDHPKLILAAAGGSGLEDEISVSSLMEFDPFDMENGGNQQFFFCLLILFLVSFSLFLLIKFEKRGTQFKLPRNLDDFVRVLKHYTFA